MVGLGEKVGKGRKIRNCNSINNKNINLKIKKLKNFLKEAEAKRKSLTKKWEDKETIHKWTESRKTQKKMADEIEEIQLSDIELKMMVIRKVNELTENYQKLHGNYNENTANYINMKKEIKNINKSQKEMKNTIS